jgi:hypothetical protein
MTLATNDKSNCLAHSSARCLDCMAGIHNELEPEVKISLTESWIVASHRPAEHTRVSNEHKLSRHLRVESVEAHKAGITLFEADCWSTAAHHCAWPTASSGWWPPPLLPVPLAILSLLLQPLLRLLRRDDSSPASRGRQASLAAVTAMATLADVCPHHLDGKRGGSQDAGSHRKRRCARDVS